MSSTIIRDDELTTADNGEWEQFSARLLEDPEAREEYERTYREVVALRRFLQTCDAEREKVGLTKSELAHRMGMNPSAIRRLFTSETGNPTFRTIVGICDVLGLELTVKRAPRHKPKKPLAVARPAAPQRVELA